MAIGREGKMEMTRYLPENTKTEAISTPEGHSPGGSS